MEIRKENGNITVVDMHNMPMTFTADGKVYHQIRLPKDEVKEVMTSLYELRPDFKIAVDVLDWDDWAIIDVADVWRNTYCYVQYDPYTGKALKRPWKQSPIEGISPILRTDAEIVKDIIEFLKIPETKAFRKLYLESFGTAKIVKAIVNCGIRDPNRILKLFSELNGITLDDYEGTPVYLEQYEGMQDAIRRITELKSEEAAVKVLLEWLRRPEINTRFIVDAPKEVLEFILKRTSSPEEIWNSIFEYSRKRGIEDATFALTEDDLQLEGTFGNLEFKLPKSRSELAILGAEMGICVGSYAQAIESRFSRIVAAYEGEKPVACFDCPESKIVQMKGKYNNPVMFKYEEAVKEWMKENKLSFNTYDTFGPNTITSTTRYDVVRPEAFEHHEQERKLEIIKKGYYLDEGDFDEQGNFIPWDEEENGWE